MEGEPWPQVLLPQSWIPSGAKEMTPPFSMPQLQIGANKLTVQWNSGLRRRLHMMKGVLKGWAEGGAEEDFDVDDVPFDPWLEQGLRAQPLDKADPV